MEATPGSTPSPADLSELSLRVLADKKLASRVRLRQVTQAARAGRRRSARRASGCRRLTTAVQDYVPKNPLAAQPHAAFEATFQAKERSGPRPNAAAQLTWSINL
jgi:hypothetical protein